MCVCVGGGALRAAFFSSLKCVFDLCALSSGLVDVYRQMDVVIGCNKEGTGHSL